MTPKPLYHGQDIRTLTHGELQEYHAVAYEVEMLGDVLGLFAQYPVRPQALENALIESFAIHVRTLATFLWDGRYKDTKETDALAVDFLKSGVQWGVGRPADVQDLVRRASKEIAHLTTYRLSGAHPDKDWTPRECLGLLVPKLEQFVQGIDPAKRSPKLEPAVRRLRGLLDSQQPAIRLMLDTNRSTQAVSRVQVINYTDQESP